MRLHLGATQSHRRFPQIIAINCTKSAQEEKCMSKPLSRRSLFQMMGAGLLGSALAACVPIQAAPPTPSASQDSANDEATLKKIEDFLGKLNESTLFSGAVLIARDGEI